MVGRLGWVGFVGGWLVGWLGWISSVGGWLVVGRFGFMWVKEPGLVGRSVGWIGLVPAMGGRWSVGGGLNFESNSVGWWLVGPGPPGWWLDGVPHCHGGMC